MKARLTWIVAFGVVLIGAGALYWSRAGRTGVSASPDAAAKSDRTAQAEQQTVGAPALPHSAPAEDRTVASNPALDAAHAAPAKTAQSAALLAPADQPLGDVWTSGSGIAESTLDVDHPADPDGFETKYAGLDATQLKGSLEAIEAVIVWQREGKFEDKSQALPAEAIKALEREQQWLKVHAYP
jgi:hypothetical protein